MNKNDFTFDILRKELEGLTDTGSAEEIGKVISVGDGVAQIEGLPGVLFSEMIEIGEDAIPAMVLNLEEYAIGAVILGEDTKIREGDIARKTGKVLSVPVGEEILGRVLNPLGKPIDGKSSLPANMKTLPIERPAPSVFDRQSVDTPLGTGIKVVDAAIPIGRGQRELIIGDRQIGKTALAQDTILNQLNEPEDKRPICIYVAIGQKASKVAKFVQELEERGAMDFTIVVVANASEPASLWYIAPYAGCSMGEYFRDKGKDVLIIYDDLSKHAWAWRQIALLLRRPPGREAYPGDVFYLHSRLLERAARLSDKKGGGSLTALPIIETQLGDVSAYIPTNVISITDGQIYLESDLFSKGQRPAVNIGLSVSRVGSAAQTKAMKKVAAKLKLDLAQFQELAAFAQFAQDLDKETKAKIDRGERLMEILKQSQYKPVPLENQVVILFAVNEGYFDSVPLERVREFEDKIVRHMEDNHPKILEIIRNSRDLTDESKEEIRKALGEIKI
ncbi:MAG: F0F1 ATP synthase subunit alpha [Candidatus Paceibacterota bacterium]|nr:MAG: F0F1 ATP synthase subunit alpha [Candidatus Paceibacterota bacterium]